MENGIPLTPKSSFKGAENECILVLDHTVTVDSGDTGEGRTVYYFHLVCGTPSGGNELPDSGGCVVNCGPQDPESIPSVPTDPSFDWDYGGGNNSPALPDPEEAIAIEINIDPKFSKDYPCFAEAVQQAYALCSELNIEFLEYFESSEDFNVVYSYEDFQIYEDPEINKASALFDYDLNCMLPCDTGIIFNQNYFGTMSDPSVAANTIHENTHAMFFYLWRSGEINLESQNPTYKELAQAYCDVLASEDPRDDGTQQTLEDLGHENMVNLTDKLAGTLLAYANSNGINVDLEYCRKMIWGGTFSTLDTYEKVFDSDERNEIAAIVNAELKNETYTYQLLDGTIQTITPEGEVITDNSCD